LQHDCIHKALRELPVFEPPIPTAPAASKQSSAASADPLEIEVAGAPSAAALAVGDASALSAAPAGALSAHPRTRGIDGERPNSAVGSTAHRAVLITARRPCRAHHSCVGGASGGE
jgi:hypothetical protein